MDFVRKSVKAIGQTAIKIDSAAERCVGVLLELISTRVSYVVQEAVVVMKVGYSQHSHIVHCSFFLGYFSKIPFDIRRRHTHVMRQP